MLKTPKSKTSILILTFLVYLQAPFTNAYGLYRDFLNGEFPPEADAIAIPIIGFFAVWLLFAPFVCSFIVWAVWKYTGKISLFGFNRNRPIWSFAWSSIFGCVFFTEMFGAFQNFFNQYFIESAKGFLIAYLALVFRAIIIFRKQV